MIEDADGDEFYRKIQFKTVILCDLKNPLIKRSDMVFNCDICGRRANRQTSELYVQYRFV